MAGEYGNEENFNNTFQKFLNRRPVISLSDELLPLVSILIEDLCVAKVEIMELSSSIEKLKNNVEFHLKENDRKLNSIISFMESSQNVIENISREAKEQSMRQGEAISELVKRQEEAISVMEKEIEWLAKPFFKRVLKKHRV